MLKALHELLMTLYTKARLTASRTLFFRLAQSCPLTRTATLETLPQALQNLCTEIGACASRLSLHLLTSDA